MKNELWAITSAFNTFICIILHWISPSWILSTFFMIATLIHMITFAYFITQIINGDN